MDVGVIQKPSLMISAVETIDKLPLADADTKGDLYEYLLGKLTTAGINGQFRTPRHIIKMMVDLVEPKPTWTIADSTFQRLTSAQDEADKLFHSLVQRAFKGQF